MPETAATAALYATHPRRKASLTVPTPAPQYLSEQLTPPLLAPRIVDTPGGHDEGN